MIYWNDFRINTIMWWCAQTTLLYQRLGEMQLFTLTPNQLSL